MADITRNDTEQRWELVEDGRVVGRLEYTEHEDLVSLTHTIVEPEHNGRGVAGDLVRTALDTLRDEGRRVRPECPYVVRWIERHPSYQDLVHTEWS